MRIAVPETKVLFTERKILKRVDELGAEVAQDYQSLVLVGILTGAYTFVADLSRSLARHGLLDVSVDFMGIHSYEKSQISSGEPKITKDLNHPIVDKHVLVGEDIIDTGYSLEKLMQILGARGAASLSIISLLSKSERRQINVPVKYTGFEIPNKYVYGYGIDDGYQQYRT